MLNNVPLGTGIPSPSSPFQLKKFTPKLTAPDNTTSFTCTPGVGSISSQTSALPALLTVSSITAVPSQKELAMTGEHLSENACRIDQAVGVVQEDPVLWDDMIAANGPAVVHEVPGVVTSPLVAGDSKNIGRYPVAVDRGHDAVEGIGKQGSPEIVGQSVPVGSKLPGPRPDPSVDGSICCRCDRNVKILELAAVGASKPGVKVEFYESRLPVINRCKC